MTDLFSPLMLGEIALRNRIVMAPLTRSRAAMPGNLPHALNVTYYAQRATAGLIISEAVPISPMAHGYPLTPGIYSPEQITGWRNVVTAVHNHGGSIVLQLWHVGRISHPSLLPNQALPVAPSALKPIGQAITYQGLQDFVTPRALEIGELAGVVEDYRQAAKNALAAGFDGVEIHAANGYLLDEFLRDGTNQRQDCYGGSLANRTRLLLEVVTAVTEVWGAARVGVRLSPINLSNDMQDSVPQTLFTYVAEALNPFGLAYLHVMEISGLIGVTPPAFDFAAFRQAFQGPYIANGDYDKVRGNAVVASGQADCVAYGRHFIANPDLVARFAQDAPLNTPDPNTFYGGDERGYIDYPTLT